MFDDTSFYLNEGEKVGILGINGTGKSTLLKMMAGMEEPDEGSVTRAKHLIVRYLPQNPPMEPEQTVLEYVMMQCGASGTSKPDGAGQGIIAGTEAELTAQVKSLLYEVGITDFEQKVGQLSGGQKKKAALAALFVGQADLLILDEPTNHLDLEIADWLEGMLKKFKGSVIMVTHDRYFLDSVSNRIVELDKGKLYSYQTNYSGFLALKTEREEMLLAGERKRQAILRTELAWVMRGARARSTKQKARLERYEELKNRTAPQSDKAVEMSSVSTRLGRTTVELHHIRKAYGDSVLIDDFSYIFLKNDRVAFIGPNGCGKTTLMKIIEGRVIPDAGERIIGQTVKIGYYSQEIETDKKEAGIAYMDPQMRVIDYIKETAEYIKTEDGIVTAAKMLENFLFEGEDQYGLIGKLSGGEKRRLNLLRVLMEAPNVLILDEPTNDLDITTLTILEDYLDHFQGIVIIVSHDRYFLDRLAGRIFAFEDGTIRQYEGGYTDYQIRKEFEQASSDVTRVNGKKEAATAQKVSDDRCGGAEANIAGNGRTQAPRKLRFSYKEQREYETIESEIAQLEEELEQLDNDMAEHASSYAKLTELTARKEETQKLLDEKMDRWMYLEELANRIEEENGK